MVIHGKMIREVWVVQILVVRSHEFVCLSILYVSVFIKAHWLLRFSGQCLNRPFLVVSTCVQIKQGAKMSPECFFLSLPHIGMYGRLDLSDV